MSERTGAVRVLALSGLCLVTTLIYGGTLSGYFLSDDLSFLYAIATWAREGQLLSRLLGGFVSPPYRREFFYRPLVDVFFAGDYVLWGVQPLGWRFTNLGLHLVNVVLVWGIVEQIVGRIPARAALATAGAAAVMFALRPCSPETVAWLSCRGDSLALLGMLSALLAYLRANGHWGRWYLAAIGSFLFALGSKEAGVTVPGGLVALHLAGAITLAPHSGESRGRAWIRQTVTGVGPFILILGAYFAWRLFLFGSAFTVYLDASPIAFADPAWRAVKLHALWFFFAPSLVWTSLATGVVFVIATQVLVGGVAACYSPAARRVWVFGVCWLIVTVLPLAQQLVITPSGEGARLFYIPGAALAVLLAAPLATLSPSVWQEDRLNRYISVAGVIGSLLLVSLSMPLLMALLRPWREAGQNMQALPAAIAARAAAVPDGGLALLLIPDHLGGALFGRNGQGALMTPPVQIGSLSDRVLVVTPLTLREFAGLAGSPPAVKEIEGWCWDVTARRFERLHLHAYSPDAWLDAWQSALRDSNCLTLAGDGYGQ